jgi:hypothetical protein
MIIARISGLLAQQLSQYAFGLECAQLLQTELKLDISECGGGEQLPCLLEYLLVCPSVASKREIASAKRSGVVSEDAQLWNKNILDRICNDMYLDGEWADYRYAESIVPLIAEATRKPENFDDECRNTLAAINTTASVAIDVRCPAPGRMALPQCYFEDAIKAVQFRVPDAHLFIFADHPVLPFNVGGNFTIIVVKDRGTEQHCIQLMRACRHYIITHNSLSCWAARLGSQAGSVVVAPQQAFLVDDDSLIGRFGAVRQPVWPKSWQVLPIRLLQTPPAPTSFKGGRSDGRPIRVGVWNFYEEITRNGFLFKNTEASIGANLLKPWCDLYEYGQAHGILFVTLDQIRSVDELDAVIFMDRPRPGHPLIDALMHSSIQKYLILYECEVIKSNNWEVNFHDQFHRIFTWSDAHVDGRRYIKTNFAIDPNSPYDFEILKTAFYQRKLATIIAGAKQSQHPNELYSDRVRTIRWFEASAPEDFDLYGMGWGPEMFPSYRGPVQDKLATLSHYRFAICYENAKNIPGYVTEKMLDCFRAGTVPVYAGAPNIDRWFPSGCYIDLRQFENYFELHSYLSSMAEAEHGAYLDRIRHYLYSEQSYPYSAECFISTVTEVIAWDVQNSRGEKPMLKMDYPDDADLANMQLVQNLKTMQIELEAVQQVSTVAAVPLDTEKLRRESFKDTGHPDLVVFFGYGDELPVFMRARALWQFFISHYPNVRAIFVRETEALGRGEVMSNGHDLLVGIGGDQAPGTLERHGYASTGTWSPSENGRAIYRQMAIYDYLLRSHDRPFYVYQSTITSVVDFRGLFALLETMPKTRCYAGMPGRLNNPPELDGLTFVCGTNSLFSSDMLALMRSRYDPDHMYATLPNDIWQALILHDIPRISMPFFSFIKPRSDGGRNGKVREMAKRLLDQGHYHFRIKTTSADAGLGAREDIDPWIMLKVMEAILDSHPSTQANLQLVERLLGSVNPGNGKTLCAFNEDGFFSGPRRFPLDDIEAEMFYADLKE